MATTTTIKTSDPFVQGLQQALETFLNSEDFKDGVISATKASWGGSGYSVELFEDGRHSVLWDNQIGNLYHTPGLIIHLPLLDDSDRIECLEQGMTEDEWWSEAWSNEQETLTESMRVDFKEWYEITYLPYQEQKRQQEQEYDEWASKHVLE